MDSTGLRQRVPLLGIVAVAVTFGAIGLAMALSPAFAPTENALSNLGDASDAAGTATTEVVFNGGLILGGVLGVGFGVGLVARPGHPLERIGAVVFALAMASMAGVGVFPQDGPYHFEVASGLYVLFSVATLCDGAGKLIDGTRRLGLFAIGVGGCNLAMWVIWTVTGGLARPGLAVPELLGALLIALWTIPTAWRLQPDRSPSPAPFARGR